MVLWITGLSGSGKTTISKAVYKEIKAEFPNTVLLDGDIIRKALNNSWGYSLDERLRGARQVAGLCAMLENEGLNVICATMCLFHEIHESNRKTFNLYIEVFLDVTMSELRRRDPKQLYARAFAGEENNVMGVDLLYEAPRAPHLKLKNHTQADLQKNIQTILQTAFEQLERESIIAQPTMLNNGFEQ